MATRLYRFFAHTEARAGVGTFSRMQHALQELDYRVASVGVLIGVSAGALAAAGVVALHIAIDLVIQAVSGVVGTEIGGLDHGIANLFRTPGTSIGWLIFLLPAVGGLISGLLTTYWAAEAHGGGSEDYVDTFHNRDARYRLRVPFAKLLATAALLGTGGSAGREGPAVLIGSSASSWLAERFKLSAARRRQMMVAGAAGGVGAAFHAPLGGALFAVEVLYRDPEFESDAVISAIISSIVGYSIAMSIFPTETLFSIPQATYLARELPLFAVLGLVTAAAASLTVWFADDLMTERVFKRIAGPMWLRPTVGGLFLGAILTQVPDVAGAGYHVVQDALEGNLALGILLTLAVTKAFASTMSTSSGGSGGWFAPSLFIGAMIGGAFGRVVGLTWSEFSVSHSAYVLGGMAGFFAAFGKLPLTMIIITAELTKGYDLIVPMMMVIAVSYTLSGRHTIYRAQVRSRFESPAHVGDFLVDVLQRIAVQDVIVERNTRITRPDMSVAGIMPIIVESTQNYFPVVDRDGRLRGIFSLDDVRKTFDDAALAEFLVVDDLAIHQMITVTPDETLDSVMQKFTVKNLDELPIVESTDSMMFVGMLSRRDVIGAYNETMYFRGFQA